MNLTVGHPPQVKRRLAHEHDPTGPPRPPAASPPPRADSAESAPCLKASGFSCEMKYIIRTDRSRRQIGRTSSIAAPLLAAAAVTVMGVIIQQPSSVARPGIALILLATATVLLVTSVGSAIWAGYYEDEPFGQAQRCNPPVAGDLAGDHAANIYRARQYWAGVAVLTYNFGLLAWAMGLIVAAIPHEPSLARWVVGGIFAAGVAADFLLRRRAPKPDHEVPYWLKLDP